jgi:hypothetical protein
MSMTEVADKQSAIDHQPSSVYEVVTRTRLEELAKDVDELKHRFNMVLWTILGAIVVDMILRMIH